MDELTVLRSFTRRFPRVPKALGVATHGVRRVFCRRTRAPAEVEVEGVRMELDPHELVDGMLLFGAHLFDVKERAFLFEGLRPGEVFVDLGANVGFYTLQAARRGARTVAVEPEAWSRSRLLYNLGINGLTAIVDPRAVAAAAGSARLGLNHGGNRGSSSLVRVGDESVEVETVPLADLLDDHGVVKVDRMKIDIEGMEAEALTSLFKSGRRPRRLVVERHRGADPDPLPLLREHGYEIHRASRHNWLGRLLD